MRMMNTLREERYIIIIIIIGKWDEKKNNEREANENGDNKYTRETRKMRDIWMNVCMSST